MTTPDNPDGDSSAVGPLDIDKEGWASTGRVLRDTSIGGVVVAAVLESGMVPPDILQNRPALYMLAQGIATVIVRFAWKYFGKYMPK